MKPASDIVLVRLEYESQLDFWFDEKTKKELAEKILADPGPVVLRMDHKRLLTDPVLSEVLRAKTNIVRPIQVLVTDPRLSPEAITLEKKLASLIQQPPPDPLKIGRPVKVEPEDPKYFQNNLVGVFLAGTSNTTIVDEYPLTENGNRLKIPSALLPSIAAYYHCSSYAYSTSRERLDLQECPNNLQARSFEIPDPLPIFFYRNAIPAIEGDLSRFPKNDPSVLTVVEVTDASLHFPTSTHKDYTMGELTVTALNNVVGGHFPWTNFWIDLLILGIFVLANLCIVWSCFRSKLRGCLGMVSFWLVGILLADFAATVLWNILTHPVAGYMASLALSVVAIATRSIWDMEERGLIERALSGYVSEDRLGRLLSGKERLALEGRRVELTTMIIDIAKFSKLTSPLSIENVFIFMQKFFSLVDPIIFKYGGTIDKKTGDGLLAFFGDSERSESAAAAARCAVYAALEIQELLEKASAQDLGLSEKLHARIGVNTGEMMLGNTGSKSHFNYTVLGDAVNFTQRLEAACPVGEVLIGRPTADYVRNSFELERFMIQVKHEPEPVEAFRVVAKIPTNVVHLKFVQGSN